MSWKWSGFHGQRHKFTTISIVLIMFTFSTIDMLLDWSNYSKLSSEPFQHGLIVGPPPESALASLVCFNIFGTVLYALEIVNMMSILFNGGHTKIPIEYEQVLILLIEEIPLAATNLGIVTCRLNNVVPTQIAAGVFAILNVAVRLYLYGYYEEWEIGRKDNNTFKVTLKIAVYITVTTTWILLVITQGIIWSHNANQADAIKHAPGPALDDVSIYFLRAPGIDNDKVVNYSLNALLRQEGVNFGKPWLLDDVKKIPGADKGGLYVNYTCHVNASYFPEECKLNRSSNATHLQFKFIKTKATSEKLFGGIAYNYAIIKDKKCINGYAPFKKNWSLFYFWTIMEVNNNVTSLVMVTSPWNGACSTPTPEWDKYIDACK